MIPWTTMLVRQVVCYSETSTCEVLNKKNSDGEQNRFQSVLAVVQMEFAQAFVNSYKKINTGYRMISFVRHCTFIVYSFF